MKVFEVAALDLREINFSPATEFEEIAQNVFTIISTAKLTVPLDRSFGLNLNLLDKPMNVTKAKLTAEIVEAVKKYEPRAKVTEVLFDGNPATGQLLPRVRFKLVQKYLRNS